MAVIINKAGRDHLAFGIDLSGALFFNMGSDAGDLVPLYGHIGLITRCAGAVHHRAPSYDQIIHDGKYPPCLFISGFRRFFYYTAGESGAQSKAAWQIALFFVPNFSTHPQKKGILQRTWSARLFPLLFPGKKWMIFPFSCHFSFPKSLLRGKIEKRPCHIPMGAAPFSFVLPVLLPLIDMIRNNERRLRFFAEKVP